MCKVANPDAFNGQKSLLSIPLDHHCEIETLHTTVTKAFISLKSSFYH
jgi:hypothetical protein